MLLVHSRMDGREIPKIDDEKNLFRRYNRYSRNSR